MYTSYALCPICKCSSNELEQVDLEDSAQLLRQMQCHHRHTTFQCVMRFNAGDVWYDIKEVCDGCDPQNYSRIKPEILYQLPNSDMEIP
jgi:hypothetical protein